MELPILFPNNIIKGKWNNNSYRVIKKLGEGGIGAVYQVIDTTSNKKYALKLSEDNLSLNREYWLLKELEGIDIVVKGYEIDDIDIGNKIYYFIVIEYIPGVTLHSYSKNKKTTVVDALGTVIILLKFMGELHEKGYILGDTKLDNIMVNNDGNAIRLIDLGGVVKIGSTIKEFTPAYDRASWKCGDRISEDSYDLFSAIMILIQLILGIDLNPRIQSVIKIKEKLNYKAIDNDLKGNIIGVLDGKKYNIKAFANTLLTLYNKERKKQHIIKKKNINYRINLFFVGSISLLISTLWLIFVK
ncbi:protein kinase domain-containing protein [Alkaliphilus sp. B6464]|uniref:protein kinase domain-containing protein n=1 Tax=Alkaliphilus sp. B6464 TaxID=2731219 RepID=UPI001BA57A32|nr:protein kinase [Alkaliphilus sp. B6464]QUH19816.1 protein kinase [Alkaliphilus sp. B6464]